MTKDLEEAHPQRMPQELKMTLNSLSTDVRSAIFNAPSRYNHAMEKGTHQLVSWMVNACLERK